MASLTMSGPDILIETDCLAAVVTTEGYVSGVKAGTLLDKQTGARDLGFGLDIVDFLLEPIADDGRGGGSHEYTADVMLHGRMPKRYVELPQICTQARKIEAQTFQGDGFVAVKLWWRYTEATYGRAAGSLWEQFLVFPDGQRYFFSADRITSANTVDDLFLRIDMPGHLKHNGGDTFEQIYLSYEGFLPNTEFLTDFAPDDKFLYQRDEAHIPERIIRAYQVKQDGVPGPWLAGMTLQPEAVSEAWCHQRGYVCFIQEVGQWRVEAGESFGAAYVVGWFDDLTEMKQVYDKHKGAGGLEVGDGWQWTE